MLPRWARVFVLLICAASLSACGLPRSGPNKRELLAASVQNRGDAFVVAVDDRVARAATMAPGIGLGRGFLNAGVVGSDTIRPGDTLGLTVYENVDDGLLSADGVNSTVLEEFQVDGDGFIFVPYAGRIRAAGNSPEAVRRVITSKLDEQTPDPQVVVRRLAGDGATVSVTGGVGDQGVYPIERPTRTLTAMLARAGGVVIEPEVAQVTIVRGHTRGRVWFQDLYENPRLDIALRAGDRILVEEDARSFTALGATGVQNRIPFETQTISAMEAIAQAGGLRSRLADPTGIFVLRNEPERIARDVLGRADISGPQRIVYVLDLTEPTGLFVAREFSIRDDDTVYVTEAPYTQFSKLVTAITGTAGAADRLTNVADN